MQDEDHAEVSKIAAFDVIGLTGRESIYVSRRLEEQSWATASDGEVARALGSVLA